MLRTALPVGRATIRGQLRAGPGYPVLVLRDDSTVVGEIWLCDSATLAALDVYEGVSVGLFQRVRTEVAGEPAWVYVAGPYFQDRELTVIPGGDWLAWAG